MTTKKEMSVIERVWANIKGGEAAEEAKVIKFFTKLRKEEKTEIKKAEANKKGVELQYEIDKSNLADRIEDAIEKVENAYDNVTAEDIKTNESMDVYAIKYWGKIRQAEYNLESLKKKEEKDKEEFEKAIKDIDEFIAKRKARIEKIS